MTSEFDHLPRGPFDLAFQVQYFGERLHGVAQAALDGWLDRAHLRSLDIEEARDTVDDVPNDDLTPHAVQKAYQLTALPDRQKMLEIAQNWQPFRTWTTGTEWAERKKGMSDDPRFPAGKFVFSEPAARLRKECIAQFREAPGLLRSAVNGLTKEQLSSRYRPEGWTLAQVVHHLAEADANAYPRLKYALTESAPPSVMVAPQELWAELPDARSVEIAGSLAMFEAIRLRWADAWESLSEKDFLRQWRHTRFGLVTVDFLLQQYAWHARHHTGHITTYRKSMGW